MSAQQRFRRVLVVERLEPRTVLSAVLPLASEAHDFGLDLGDIEFTKVLTTGMTSGPPGFRDSQSNRIDPNVPDSPFAGVGSLYVHFGDIGALTSGTLLDPTHVLTAAHSFDVDDDGMIDAQWALFILNDDNPASDFDGARVIPGSEIHMHPDFTGFGNPSVNDDIAILELAVPVDGVPTYTLLDTPLEGGEEIVLAGYGCSADGLSVDYKIDASFFVKRSGGNVADWFEPDDEGAPTNEVFLFDFDGPLPTGVNGPGILGGPTLGNRLETQLGPGDSGGPSFVRISDELRLVGINTFTASLSIGPVGAALPPPFGAPHFGSLGGGILAAPYIGWIQQVLQGGQEGLETASASLASPLSSQGRSELASSATFTALGAASLPLAFRLDPLRYADAFFAEPVERHPASPSGRQTQEADLAIWENESDEISSQTRVAKSATTFVGELLGTSLDDSSPIPSAAEDDFSAAADGVLADLSLYDRLPSEQSGKSIGKINRPGDSPQGTLRFFFSPGWG